MHNLRGGASESFFEPVAYCTVFGKRVRSRLRICSARASAVFFYLNGAASFEGHFDLVGEISVSRDEAGAVPVEVSVRDAVERLLEFEFGLHGAGGAVERRFGPVQEDDRRQVVQLGHFAVQRGLLGQTAARRVLDAVAVVGVVGLARRQRGQRHQQ